MYCIMRLLPLSHEYHEHLGEERSNLTYIHLSMDVSLFTVHPVDHPVQMNGRVVNRSS